MTHSARRTGVFVSGAAPAIEALYPGDVLTFGPQYLIPKPFDTRVVVRVATAVAEAAMRTSVAGLTVDVTRYAADVAHRVAKHAAAPQGATS